MKPPSNAPTAPLPLERLSFAEVATEDQRAAFSRDVAVGLASEPKSIPPLHFYDEAGSRLFEAITQLPEYYLTRAEQRILESNAHEIVQSVPGLAEMVEFGSGSSKKTRLLIEAALLSRDSIRYTPIDISGSFLRQSALRLIEDYATLQVHAIAAEYGSGLLALPEPQGPRLFLFMGSSIGNLEKDDAIRFLRQIRMACRPEDRLLLGADLVKDVAEVEAAYDDASGVTEAFNKNLLVRINRELGGNFVPDCFRHEAPFVKDPSWIEMRLVSLREQTVTVDDLGRSFRFAEGERLITEHCTKYTIEALSEMALRAGFRVEKFWFDDHRRFTVALMEPLGP